MTFARVLVCRLIRPVVLGTGLTCAFLLASCASGAGGAGNLCEKERNAIRETVYKELIKHYDHMEPQFDDPLGRRYCLALDFRLRERGRPAPATLLSTFSDHPHVHGLAWCQENDGRILSVGPINCVTPTQAEVWSFSFVPSRSGGSECLHTVVLLQDKWKTLPGCSKGGIYN